MADAKLGKDAWTGFVKKQKLEKQLDDAALLKVLEKLDKSAGTADALEAVGEQVKKLLVQLAKQKKDLGDKLFTSTKDKLNELLDEAETRLKHAGAQAGDAHEEEEADSPALLTSTMIPLVRQLLKGDVQMRAMIAVSSKKAAVLIMRKPISPSRRKLLAEYLGETSGLKYFTAEVGGGTGQLEFLLDGSPGGLSKKLRQAVFEQTGLRCRVALRFGEETETDGEDDAGGATTQDTQAAPPDTAAAADPAADAYQQRLDALEPRYLAALQASPETAGKMRAVRAFADGKAGAGQYAAALKGLDALAALFGTGTPARAAPSGAQVIFTRVRLDWQNTRKTVRAELQALEDEILAESEEEPDFADISTGTGALFEMLETLDERLIDKLDEALNSSDPAQRRALHAQALEIVGGYRDFVRSDALLADIDDNGFLDLEVRATLDGALAAMAAQLDTSLALNH